MPEHTDKPLIILPGPERNLRRKLDDPERRNALRFSFTAAAEVTDLRSQTRIAGRSSDLGLGGCYIDTLSPFSAGTVVRLRMEHDLHVFEATALVAYSHVTMGMGLSYTNIKPEHQAILQLWMDDLSGGLSPEPEAPVAGPQTIMPTATAGLGEVMKELIHLMIRRKLISQNEGSELLRQIQD